MTERKPQKPTRSVQGNRKEESEKGRKAWERPLSTSRIQLLSQQRAEGGHWGSWLTSRRTPAQSLHHGAQRGGPDMPGRARAHPDPSLLPPPPTQLRYTGCLTLTRSRQPLCTVDSQCRQVSPSLAAKSGVDLQVGSAQSSCPASGLREPERAPETCCGPSNAGGWVAGAGGDSWMGFQGQGQGPALTLTGWMTSGRSRCSLALSPWISALLASI